MTPTTAPPLWRAIQRENYTDLKSLMDDLELDLAQRAHFIRSARFTLNLPKRLAQKMEKGTLNDPLLKQFIPLEAEREIHKGFSIDPVEDQNFQQETRLLKKYKGRALLLTTSACVMHCRYCFRQNFDYGDSINLTQELERIDEDKSLHEVILSGGDPLSLSDEKLGGLLATLEGFSHISKVRFHTRFPIGIPERIDDSFLNLLEGRRYKLYFVFHINHPRELDAEVIAAIERLQRQGIITLNQAVLLRGVNDNFETQLELHEQLVNAGILPYYLHQLDRVQGAAHFEVEKSKGLAIIEYLRNHLPGYAVPRYVQEIPNRKSKTPLVCG